MRLIIVGSEYAGKTTLANEIVKWRNSVMGPPTPLGIVEYHDHFTLPWVGHWDEISDEDLEKFMELGPELKEMFQRYQFSYHLSPMLYRDTDHILIGFHIEEAVYAPRYYGYGKKGEYGDRESMVRHIEAEIIERAPDTVLILVKSKPEVIKERMRKYPHTRTVLREEDVDETVDLFEEHYNHSLLRYRFVLDTSEATVDQTREEFVEKIAPLLSDSDRLRIQIHSTRLLGG
ncbi:hypothetical protein M1O55_01365 [Dehalococcoidia bacterium]|nr:hypothetical protein [Dehalococcoidia bacterium]